MLLIYTGYFSIHKLGKIVYLNNIGSVGMVRVLWFPLTRPAVSRQARAGRGLHRALEVAATINMQLPRGEWNPVRGRAGGQGLPRTRGMAVLGAPPPGQVMPGARGQGAGGQGAGCAQVVGGGASRPASQSEARCGWPDTPDSQSEEGENIFFMRIYFQRTGCEIT